MTISRAITIACADCGIPTESVNAWTLDDVVYCTQCAIKSHGLKIGLQKSNGHDIVRITLPDGSQTYSWPHFEV